MTSVPRRVCLHDRILYLSASAYSVYCTYSRRLAVLLESTRNGPASLHGPIQSHPSRVLAQEGFVAAVECVPNQVAWRVSVLPSGSEKHIIPLDHGSGGRCHWLYLYGTVQYQASRPFLKLPGVTFRRVRLSSIA